MFGRVFQIGDHYFVISIVILPWARFYLPMYLQVDRNRAEGCVQLKGSAERHLF